ncbi:23871_t:CDS:2, partial [Racocetra persica]
WNVNPDELAKHVNEKILPKLCFDPSPTICVRTARKWLKIFGFEYLEVAFPNLPSEACVITYPSKDGDGWWNSDDLVDQ